MNKHEGSLWSEEQWEKLRKDAAERHYRKLCLLRENVRDECRLCGAELLYPKFWTFAFCWHCSHGGL